MPFYGISENGANIQLDQYGYSLIAVQSTAGQRNAARYRDPALPNVTQPVAHSVPSALSQQILQYNVVEHRIRQQALELGVLVFE
jgi:hypothetical protein